MWKCSSLRSHLSVERHHQTNRNHPSTGWTMSNSALLNINTGTALSFLDVSLLLNSTAMTAINENGSVLELNMSQVDIGDNATNSTRGETEFEKLSKDVMFWSLSVIIPVGLLFNFISIPVFMSKPLRRRSASWYLAALAVADSTTLLTCFLDYWMKNPHIDYPVTQFSTGLCVMTSYFSCASRLFSAVLITSFTVERFICVVAPLRRAALSKPARARLAILVQCSLCFLCTLFVPFTLEVNQGLNGRKPECDVRRDVYTFYLICTALVLLLGSIILPIVVIFTLNTFIMKKVCLRRSSLAVRTSSVAHGGLAKRVRRRSFNTVYILLTVSTSFVILNLPYGVSFLMLYLQASGIYNWGPQELGNLFAAKYLTSIPYYLNYCINFLLYNVCARAFRVEMGRQLCSACKLSEERRASRRRNLSLSRPTQVEKLSMDSRNLSKKMCNQFFTAPNCGGQCIRPEVSSFTSDPAYPRTPYHTDRFDREGPWKHVPNWKGRGGGRPVVQAQIFQQLHQMPWGKR